MKLIHVLKGAALAVLFVTALSATFTFITNMTLTEVVSYVEDKEWQISESGVKAATYMERNTAVEEKNELHESRDVESALKSIEQAIDLSEYEKETVLATGYTAGFESTGKNTDHPEYGITYSGLEVKRDLYSTIAADLNVYPLGTILFIPDYGYGVVADKGSAITGNRIDLYYPTVEEVYAKWGKKETDVYVIKMGDGEITQETLNSLNNIEAKQVFRKDLHASP